MKEVLKLWSGLIWAKIRIWKFSKKFLSKYPLSQIEETFQEQPLTKISKTGKALLSRLWHWSQRKLIVEWTKWKDRRFENFHLWRLSRIFSCLSTILGGFSGHDHLSAPVDPGRFVDESEGSAGQEDPRPQCQGQGLQTGTRQHCRAAGHHRYGTSYLEFCIPGK